MCSPLNAPAAEKLTLPTWSEYIDPSIVADFEEQYDAQITFEYYESTENLAKLLTKAGNNLHDVVIIDGSDTEHYINLGWLEPIRKNRNQKYYSSG